MKLLLDYKVSYLIDVITRMSRNFRPLTLVLMNAKHNPVIVMRSPLIKALDWSVET